MDGRSGKVSIEPLGKLKGYPNDNAMERKKGWIEVWKGKDQV